MTILSSAQKELLEELKPIALIATDGSKDRLQGIRPRTSTLILGPSGSGKTFVAELLAKWINLPCLRINVASWILIAGKSDNWTWKTIMDWLCRLTDGGVLIVDEIDKLGTTENSSEYTKYLRLELHDLLDCKIPPQLEIPKTGENTDSLHDLIGELWDTNDPMESKDSISGILRGEIDRKRLEDTLRNRVFLIGCGAFQQAWIANGNPPKEIGFTTNSGKTAGLKTPTPSRCQILSQIDPELRQRFRDKIAVLPPMTQQEYIAVSDQILASIPFGLRDAWIDHRDETIRTALEGNLGIRAFEELLLKAMVESRKSEEAKNPVTTTSNAPQKNPAPSRRPANEYI